MKSVYLSLKEATKKWTGRMSGWGEIYSQLSIYFEGRIKKNRMIKLPSYTILYFEFTQNSKHSPPSFQNCLIYNFSMFCRFLFKPHCFEYTAFQLIFNIFNAHLAGKSFLAHKKCTCITVSHGRWKFHICEFSFFSTKKSKCCFRT